MFCRALQPCYTFKQYIGECEPHKEFSASKTTLVALGIIATLTGVLILSTFPKLGPIGTIVGAGLCLTGGLMALVTQCCRAELKRVSTQDLSPLHEEQHLSASQEVVEAFGEPKILSRPSDSRVARASFEKLSKASLQVRAVLEHRDAIVQQVFGNRTIREAFARVGLPSRDIVCMSLTCRSARRKFMELKRWRLIGIQLQLRHQTFQAIKSKECYEVRGMKYVCHDWKDPQFPNRGSEDEGTILSSIFHDVDEKQLISVVGAIRAESLCNIARHAVRTVLTERRYVPALQPLFNPPDYVDHYLCVEQNIQHNVEASLAEFAELERRQLRSFFSRDRALGCLLNKIAEIDFERALDIHREYGFHGNDHQEEHPATEFLKKAVIFLAEKNTASAIDFIKSLPPRPPSIGGTHFVVLAFVDYLVVAENFERALSVAFSLKGYCFFSVLLPLLAHKGIDGDWDKALHIVRSSVLISDEEKDALIMFHIAGEMAEKDGAKALDLIRHHPSKQVRQKALCRVASCIQPQDVSSSITTP